MKYITKLQVRLLLFCKNIVLGGNRNFDAISGPVCSIIIISSVGAISICETILALEMCPVCYTSCIANCGNI